LLQKLLTRDPTQRIGNCGAHEIKQHPFFADVDWNAVYRREQEMPKAYLAEMALDIID
jgi:hypothetical protein